MFRDVVASEVNQDIPEADGKLRDSHIVGSIFDSKVTGLSPVIYIAVKYPRLDWQSVVTTQKATEMEEKFVIVNAPLMLC